MVSFRPPKAQCLVWVDIETPGLPSDAEPMNWASIPPLEICVIVTDFDLEPFAGFESLITPTPATVAALRAKGNGPALEMHTNSGLLADLKAAVAAGETLTVEEFEMKIIDLFQKRTTFDKGEFMLAGSGVGTFDYSIIKTFMPRLASWLAYYPFDIGVLRRTARILSGGRQLVEPNTSSYGDLKLHRARADVEAHIAEARQWREFFRTVAR